MNIESVQNINNQRDLGLGLGPGNVSVRQWVCVAMRLPPSGAWEELRLPEGALTRDAGIPISSLL